LELRDKLSIVLVLVAARWSDVPAMPAENKKNIPLLFIINTTIPQLENGNLQSQGNGPMDINTTGLYQKVSNLFQHQMPLFTVAQALTS
jgi:hypothetical protein